MQVEISSSLEIEKRRLKNECLQKAEYIQKTMKFGIAILLALVICLFPSGTYIRTKVVNKKFCIAELSKA